MSDHLVYHGETIIGQETCTMYHWPGKEALYMVIDNIFLSYEWVLLASWVNDTNQRNTYEQTYHCDIRVKSGKEVGTQLDFSAAFKGLGFGIGSSTKTFTEEETTKSSGKTVTVNVGPTSSVYFYQKRYKFKTQVWFRLDAWNELWTVGNYEAPGVYSLDAFVEIDSNEYLSKPRPLSGHGTIPVEAKSDIVKHSNVRQLEHCGWDCRRVVICMAM